MGYQLGKGECGGCCYVLLRLHLCLIFFGNGKFWKSHLTGLELSNPRVLWQGNTSICPCSDHEFEIFLGHHESSWFPNVAYIVIDNWPPIDSKMPWNYEHCVLSHRYIHTFIYNCFHCWGPVSALNPLGYNVPCPLPTFPPKFRFWKRSKRSDARKWMTEFVMLGRLGQHGHFTLLVVSL